MTNTEAINTAGSLVYVYDRWITAIGDTAGNPPDYTDTFTDCTAVRVVQSASGSRLDFAELQYALDEPLQNRTQPASFTRMVGVYFDDASYTRVHLGDYVSETEAVRQQGDTLAAQSQLRDYHFGDPITGYYVTSPLAGQLLIEHEVVFNPLVDGVVVYNRSQTQRDGLTSYRWIHAEAARSDTAELYHGDEPQAWSLKEAVQALCDLLNSDETFVANPSTSNLTTLDTAPEIRDVKLAFGMRLHQCLDKLLIPLGYNWYVNYDTGAGKPEITLFEIGVGDEKELFLQSVGEYLSLDLSNVNQYQATRSIGDSFNQVRVYGDYERLEMTVPLVPAWPTADDSMTAADLDKTDTASDYVGHELTWRQWVMNEAGDIDESRVFGDLSFAVPNLTDAFTLYLPHRRNIEEPLTYAGGADSRERRPLYVEYSTDSGDTWQPAPETWPIKLLPDQVGILFDGDQPPSELVDASTAARVRITGTIAGDSRLQAVASKQSYAVNGREYEVVIDAADKFQKRSRLTAGDYASVLADTSNEADEVDDTDALTEYAEAVRDKNHHAEVDAEFRLPGLHLYYQIGDLITRISGRELSMDAASSTSPTPRYPQIVERRFEFGEDGPFTVLIVDRGIDQRGNA